MTVYNSVKVRDNKKAREVYEEKYATLLLANADYEERRQRIKGHSVSLRQTERHWKIPAGSLIRFRGGHNRRAFGKVKVLKGKTAA